MIDNQLADNGKKVSCDDCIHCKACKDLREDMLSLFETTAERKITYEEYNQAQYCENFKARSEFIVLPCRVGGDCYFINKNGDIQRGTLDTVFLCTSFSDLIIIAGRDERYNISMQHLGKLVFSTSEQAEQALKERE